MSRFFIDRPIFAMVLSIVMTIMGGVALLGLPIAQYPEVTPQRVEAANVGATAAAAPPASGVQNTVAQTEKSAAH